jgi:hypothetical protein
LPSVEGRARLGSRNDLIETFVYRKGTNASSVLNYKRSTNRCSRECCKGNTNMSMEKHGEPEPILWPFTEQTEPTTEQTELTDEEIAQAIEDGGPWITLEFTSSDGAFVQRRVFTLTEAEDVLASLGSEIAKAKTKYNIPQETEE